MGRTSHLNGTLDPVWDLEIFPIDVDLEGPDGVQESTLRIECRDWDKYGRDDVLGHVELKGWKILELVHGDASGPERGSSSTWGGGDPADAASQSSCGFIQSPPDGSSYGTIVGVPPGVYVLRGDQRGEERSGGVRMHSTATKERSRAGDLEAGSDDREGGDSLPGRSSTADGMPSRPSVATGDDARTRAGEGKSCDEAMLLARQGRHHNAEQVRGDAELVGVTRRDSPSERHTGGQRDAPPSAAHREAFANNLPAPERARSAEIGRSEAGECHAELEAGCVHPPAQGREQDAAVMLTHYREGNRQGVRYLAWS